MGLALDWLDAYRAASLRIADLYSDTAALECGCDGQVVLVGKQSIAEYWRERFLQKPAGELVDIHPDGMAVILSYETPVGIVQAILNFDTDGKLSRSRCGPIDKATPLRRAQR